MLVTQLQHGQNNSIAKHYQAGFSHLQFLFVVGQAPVAAIQPLPISWPLTRTIPVTGQLQ